MCKETDSQVWGSNPRPSFDTETRQKYDVILKSHNNENSKMNSINYKIGNAWNELPFDIKDGLYRTVSNFSKHVKKHYLSKYDRDCKIKKCYICKRK